MSRSRPPEHQADRTAAAAALAAGAGAHRQAAGLSLSALAERSGLSVGFLSQIESGQANPTLAALTQLAAGLGVEVPDLLTPTPRPPAHDGEVRLRVRRPPAPPVGEPTGRVWELTAPGARQLRACLVQAAPGDHAVPITHDGEEVVVVLRAGYRLQVGETVEDLGPEDLAHFPANQPHALTPLADSARALVILSSP